MGRIAKTGHAVLVSGSRSAERTGAWGHMTDALLSPDELAPGEKNPGMIETFDFGPNLKQGMPQAYRMRKAIQKLTEALHIPFLFTLIDRTFFRANQTYQESIRPVASTDRAETYTQNEFFEPANIIGANGEAATSIKRRRRERTEVAFVFAVTEEDREVLHEQYDLIRDARYNLRSRHGGISCTMFTDILHASVQLDFGALLGAGPDRAAYHPESLRERLRNYTSHQFAYTSGTVRRALREHLEEHGLEPVEVLIPAGEHSEEMVPVLVYEDVEFKNGKIGTVIVNPHWRGTDLEAVELVQLVHAAGYLNLPGIQAKPPREDLRVPEPTETSNVARIFASFAPAPWVGKVTEKQHEIETRR